MTKPTEEPLRGDAAWRAAKQKISDSNEAAYKRGRERRAAQDQLALSRQREAARLEDQNMPRQPDLD